MLFDEITAQRDQVLAIAKQYHIANIRLFGSVARREERPDSDIDMLVSLETPGLMYLAGFKVEMEELFGRRVDVVKDTTVHEIIREQVLSEARPL